MKALEYMEGITGARRTLTRFGRVNLVPTQHSAFFQKAASGIGPDVRDHVGTLAGAAAGAILWGKHRVLGGIAGASLGRNVPALFNAQTRQLALTNIGVTKLAILGSLIAKNSPIVGFGVGWVLGNALVYFGKWR